MAKLGSINIFNEVEKRSYSVDVTEYDVEKGSPFSDHVRKTNPTITVTGMVLSNNWKTIESRLESMMNKGTILKYVGKTTVSNVILTGFSPSNDKNIANGFKVSLTLKRIRITKTSYRKAPKKKKPARKKPTYSGKKKPTGKRKNPKKYIKVVSGDTYWGRSIKHGVSVKQLMAWNPWPARRIPIGVKMRVG